MKNKFIIGIFTIIVIASLIIPKIALFLLEDRNIDKLYKTNANMLQANNIKNEDVLIKTIYSKYNGEKYSISTSDTYEFATLYYEIDGEKVPNKELVKLQELEKLGMIKNSLFSYLEKNKTMIARINEYQSDNMNYSKIRIFLPTNDYSIAFMSFEVEHTTGKIMALKIPKEYVNVQMDVMKDYAEYLGFSKSDWIYEKKSIKSLTNKLEIKVEDINNIISISIVPYNN